MAKFRLCENPTSKWLRETFKANPLLMPEQRFKPLTLVLKQNDEYRFLGSVNNLFVPGTSLDVALLKEPMANASLDRTMAMKIDVGLNILSGFFRALKMDSISLKVAFERAREISLSFRNVNRNYIDVLELGNIISSKEVNFKNPVVGKLEDDGTELYLITDAITSKGFGINDHKKHSTEVGIDIPLIEKYIADANLDIKTGGDKKTNISFEGNEELTFAFSCARFKLNEESKSLQFESIFTKGFAPEAVSPNQLEYKTMVDDDEYEPAMIVIE